MTLETYDDRTATPVTCLCGRRVSHGPCDAVVRAACPFDRRSREVQPLSRVVMAQPDTEQCE